MSDPAEARGAHAYGSVAEARDALIAWVDAAGDTGRFFLQAHLARRATGYEIRHRADAAVPTDRLLRERDPFRAREIAQTRSDGGHRPLKTAPNLRRGWMLERLDEAGMWTALDYLYPACARHWHAGATGRLRVTHWSATAARQTGIYSAVGLLERGAVRDTVRACCADVVCLRTVAWGLSPELPEPLQADPESVLAPGADPVIPCPEACSLFISLARTVLSVEREPRGDVPGLGLLSAGEVEQINALVSAAAAGTLGSVREGEFQDPVNHRRVRYLAARLRTL